MENLHISHSIAIEKKAPWMNLIALTALVSLVALAYYFSSQPAMISRVQSGSVLELFKSFGFENMTMHFVRKLAHFTLFGTIGGAFAIALSFKFAGFHLFGLSFAFGSIAGAFDELHQMFVPGRGPQIKDVMIDSAGSFVGAMIICTLIYVYKKQKQNA